MRDPKRIPKVLKELGKIWKKYPDLRLGQLLLNLGFDFYYVEDNNLIKKLTALYDKIDKLYLPKSKERKDEKKNAPKRNL